MPNTTERRSVKRRPQVGELKLEDICKGGRHTVTCAFFFSTIVRAFAELGLDKPMTVRRGAQPKGYGRKRTSASEAPRPEAKRGKEGGSAGQGQEKKSAAKDRRGPSSKSNKRR